MADLVSTLGPDVAPDSSPVGQGPMSDEQADLLAAAYGFGSPTEGVAGAQEGFTGFGFGDPTYSDEGLGGDRNTLKGVTLLERDKEGRINWPEWAWPYLNYMSENKTGY